MLKPNDDWTWFFDDSSKRLRLDLGQDLVFQPNLARKLLVDCAFQVNQFTVDDASAFQTYRERLSTQPISSYRQDELALHCVAARRFHKPVQPKSWYFQNQYADFKPEEGTFVELFTEQARGLFIVVEVGENASLLCYVEAEELPLTSSKGLQFGECIKVMHDRMSCVEEHSFCINPTIAMAG